VGMEVVVEPRERLPFEEEEIDLGAKCSKNVEYHEPELAYHIAITLELTQTDFCEHVGWPDLNILRNAMRRHGMTWGASHRAGVIQRLVFGKIGLENSIESYKRERLRLLQEQHAEITTLQCEIRRLRQDQESGGRRCRRVRGRANGREVFGESAVGSRGAGGAGPGPPRSDRRARRLNGRVTASVAGSARQSRLLLPSVDAQRAVADAANLQAAAAVWEASEERAERLRAEQEHGFLASPTGTLARGPARRQRSSS
jgi:hypothetical protein